jgi:hypothetical protein
MDNALIRGTLNLLCPRLVSTCKMYYIDFGYLKLKITRVITLHNPITCERQQLVKYVSHRVLGNCSIL